MRKLSFVAAAAVSLSIAVPMYAQNADPDVNKLPAGPLKQTVATACSACHDLGRIVNGSYDAAGWHNGVNMMMNAGAALTPDQVEPVTQYLIKSFPEKEGNVFKPVDGLVKVTITE